MKRHHDHSNSYKEKHLIEVVAYNTEDCSIVIMAEGMVAYRQTWYWLHLVVNRKWTETLGGILSTENLKANPHGDTLPPSRTYPLQQSYI